jgi:hypothetical protein
MRRPVGQGAVSIKSSHLQQFAHSPDVIGDPSGHRWCHPQRLMTTAEVVVCKPAGQRRPMILPFLAESVREPREPPRAHPNRKILAFDMRGTDALWVRLAHDWDYLHGGNFRRAVPPFAFARGPVHLDEHGEVRAIFKRIFDCRAVWAESVRRDLEISAGCQPQALDENVRGGLVPLDEREVQNQFGVALDSDGAVGIPKVRIVARLAALFLFLDGVRKAVTARWERTKKKG